MKKGVKVKSAFFEGMLLIHSLACQRFQQNLSRDLFPLRAGEDDESHLCPPAV